MLLVALPAACDMRHAEPACLPPRPCQPAAYLSARRSACLPCPASFSVTRRILRPRCPLADPGPLRTLPPRGTGAAGDARALRPERGWPPRPARVHRDARSQLAGPAGACAPDRARLPWPRVHRLPVCIPSPCAAFAYVQILLCAAFAYSMFSLCPYAAFAVCSPFLQTVRSQTARSTLPCHKTKSDSTRANACPSSIPSHHRNSAHPPRVISSAPTLSAPPRSRRAKAATSCARTR
jgi:hypothetical protein